MKIQRAPAPATMFRHSEASRRREAAADKQKTPIGLGTYFLENECMFFSFVSVPRSPDSL